MIIDAALLTLKIQRILLENNFSLKDASSYNIQFDLGNPIFIDFGSIESTSSNGVWIAYNQFCQHFLYPLFAVIFKQGTIPSIYLSHLEGLTIEETVRSLGFKPFLKYRAVFDYFIPAMLTRIISLRKVLMSKTVSVSREFKNSTEIQLGTVKRLQKLMKKITRKHEKSEWRSYTEICLYNEEEYNRKKDFVKNSLQSRSVRSVLDIGCNTGDFSIIAAKCGCNVVSIDSDHACIDHLYFISKTNKYSILPLCVNISNPSPAIGWFNNERESFLHRCKKKFECVFGLALIHHLMVTSRIPLNEIANLFSYLSNKYIIIEYIDISDKMFKELIKYRNESYTYFNRELFEESMETRFIIRDKIDFIDRDKSMDRCIYLMECQNSDYSFI
jgi:SAM-dependent methyltransferase